MIKEILSTVLVKEIMSTVLATALVLGLLVGLVFGAFYTGAGIVQRIRRLESRCVPSEQAGNRESGWESSQPLGGGDLIHYE